MQELNEINNNAKKNILNKISNSFLKPEINNNHLHNNHSDIFNYSEDDLELMFAKEFNKVNGNFIFCENEEECFNKIQNVIIELNLKNIYCIENNLIQKFNLYNLHDLINSDLIYSDVAITTCDLLIARTGSIAISSLKSGDRLSSVFSPIHFCIAYNYQVVKDISDALNFYKKKYIQYEIAEQSSFFTLITGPSKTADIEKTLVKGVHGPEEVFVFFINQD